ncbi:MAG: replication-relaxation family protein [Janthinobacterium lividum]
MTKYSAPLFGDPVSAESVLGRQSRWTPAPRPVLLNAYDWTMLETVAVHQPVTLPQLSRLLGRSEKGCQRTSRRLFDAQLVFVLPGPPTSAMSPQNAPTVRGLTEAGARRVGSKRYEQPPAWKLEHELLVRDVAAWAAASSRASGLAPPEIRYAPQLAPRLVPDAVLTVPVGEKALCALVECDRSTEPARQWRDKAQKYARLLGLPDLTDLIGRPKARLAVICPDLSRCHWVDELLREAGVAAWFTPISLLEQDGFGQWRVSGGGVQPFLLPSNHPSHD